MSLCILILLKSSNLSREKILKMLLNIKSRNSNAADEVKILQTEAEGKKLEIQRLQDKCSLHENENKDLQKKHSKVLEERDNLFQRYLP